MQFMTDVLVVDDDAAIRDLVSHKLRQLGFDVRIAEDGEGALREIGQAVPDVVILDDMMPGLSGQDVLRRLREDATTASVRVIMLSGRGQESDVERGFRLGADDYVPKPFSPRELASRVQAVLARPAP
jgi:DNA-binding response OmpR family regulator